MPVLAEAPPTHAPDTGSYFCQYFILQARVTLIGRPENHASLSGLPGLRTLLPSIPQHRPAYAICSTNGVISEAEQKAL